MIKNNFFKEGLRMSIQKEDLTLKGVKLKIEFIDGCLLDKITRECNNSFRKILNYEVSNIYNNENEQIMTVLFKRRGGIEYRIVLKPKCLNFYAKIEFDHDIENIFSELKNVIVLFYDFVYKMQDCKFKIVNIVFSKCINIPESEIKEYFEYPNAIAENGIGLYIKSVQNDRFNVLLNSYFLEKREENEFINNIDRDICRLYNISYK